MKHTLRSFWIVSLLSSIPFLVSFYTNTKGGGVPKKLPYRSAGLTEKAAAAHLLNRLAFGATPAQVTQLLKTGLEKWVAQQLDGSLPEDSIVQSLKRDDLFYLSNAQIASKFLYPNEVIKLAANKGRISLDTIGNWTSDAKNAFVESYMEDNDIKPYQQLHRQLIKQKIFRAAYGNNQLHEVLTDFWFNHFNVSMGKSSCARFIPGYERDVIRPNVTGSFADLLLATAKSPAMLYYLDNVRSSAPIAGNNSSGVNENYAREVMELHTLGVDGGYTQKDVSEAARILSGWTVYPINQMSDNDSLAAINETKILKDGSTRDGDFLFAKKRHDNGEKHVLGSHFKNDGYQEGVRLLNLLAHHKSTAYFISRKLAIRFVADDPPSSLVKKMAQTFEREKGDIKQVLTTMIYSTEFWDSSSVRQKIKSPFEYGISAVRSVNIAILDSYRFYNWIGRMGQKVYFSAAPTGFPDVAKAWINTGSLLNRMNFGITLASQRIPGTRVNLLALNNYHEPESPAAALETYGHLIIAERDLNDTFKRLSPLLNDPKLKTKIEAAATKMPAPVQSKGEMEAETTTDEDAEEVMVAFANNKDMLEQVVGMLIGSPEFQRR